MRWCYVIPLTVGCAGSTENSQPTAAPAPQTRAVDYGERANMISLEDLSPKVIRISPYCDSGNCVEIEGKQFHDVSSAIKGIKAIGLDRARTHGIEYQHHIVVDKGLPGLIPKLVDFCVEHNVNLYFTPPGGAFHTVTTTQWRVVSSNYVLPIRESND